MSEQQQTNETTVRSELIGLVRRLREEAESHQTVYTEDRRRKQLLGDAADEIERLRGLLAEAADYVQDWGAYASDYFQEKYDLDGTVKRLRYEAYLDA